MATSPIVAAEMREASGQPDEPRRPAATTGGGKSAEDFLRELKENPDKLLDPEEVFSLLEEEFPEAEKNPTPRDMDNSILKEGPDGLPYTTGQWIERRGNDMTWHLEPIRRTTKSVNQDEEDEREWDIWYKTSSGKMFHIDEVRAPAEGLQRQFGLRPFLWQQWAMLRCEHTVRFQDNHERDFEVVNFKDMGREFFEEWLYDPRNKDFLELYESKPVGAQEKLKHHLFTPFKFMHDVVNDEEEWDMEAANASVYQYNAFLGSGWLTSFFIIFIQLTVPVLLLLFTVRESSRFPAYGDGVEAVPEGERPLVASYDVGTIFTTDFDTFCNQGVALDAILMNCVVFIIYTIRVVPEVIDNFYATVGDKDSVSSKLNSIRQICWAQGDDDTFMQIGYKLDRYMNSVYIAFINLLMLFLLFLTESTVDVILNALAIEFVYNFDREIPRSVWYDPDKRYLRASVIEIMLRGALLLEPLESPKLFCKTYDVDEAEYMEKVGGPIKDRLRAQEDANNPQFMSAKDRLWISSAKAAEELDKEEAMWQFKEHQVYFGMVDNLFKPGTGIFNQYPPFFTWSKWDATLFLPKVPQVGEVSEFMRLASVARSTVNLLGGDTNKSFMKSFTAPKDPAMKIQYLHYDPDSHKGATFRFWKGIKDVFKCTAVVSSVMVAVNRRKYHQIPFRFIDGVFEWVSFFFVVFVFPFSLAGYAYLILGCQPMI